MNEQRDIGILIAQFLYILEGVVVLSVGAVRGNITQVVFYSVLSAWLITFLILNFLKKRVPFGAYCGTLIMLSTLYGAGMCYVLRNQYILLIIFLMQWMISMMYLNKPLCNFMLVLQILTAIFLTSFPSEKLEYKFRTLELFLAIVSFFLAYWLCVKLIEILDKNTKQVLEQEQGLDDLLRVVEAKCDEARLATKSKSDFLSSMSHEIRTPINSILGMNEMIIRENRDKQILEYATNVENSGKMLLALINEILDFSKIESGKMELVEASYDMSSVLYDIISMLGPRAKQKGLHFRARGSEHIPEHLFGDELRIRQIMTNLLTNAIKYTEAGEVLFYIDYEDIDATHIMLKVSVEDTGKGIKEENIGKLFDSFQRVDEVKNRSIEGTGLGLAITKRFIDMMGGSIQVESQYGEGSKFSFSIPQKKLSNEEMGDFNARFNKRVEEREHYEESFQAPDAQVLVVDDNQMNLKVVELLLKSTKVQLDLANSGSKAIEKLRQGKQYDIIFLDHMMPDMDGIETLSIIKQEGLAKDIPIIALTANAISGAKEMYLNNGFTDYLAKPIAGEVLERSLMNYLPKDKLTIKSKAAGEETPKDSAQENMENKVENAEFQNLPEVDEFHWDVAAKYCADEEMLRMTCQMFYESLTEEGDKIKELEGKVDEEESLNLYRIKVHGLKSTALSVGAIILSSLARMCEVAAKEKDIDRIHLLTPVLLEEMRKHQERLEVFVS